MSIDVNSLAQYRISRGEISRALALLSPLDQNEQLLLPKKYILRDFDENRAEINSQGGILEFYNVLKINDKKINITKKEYSSELLGQHESPQQIPSNNEYSQEYISELLGHRQQRPNLEITGFQRQQPVNDLERILQIGGDDTFHNPRQYPRNIVNRINTNGFYTIPQTIIQHHVPEMCQQPDDFGSPAYFRRVAEMMYGYFLPECATGLTQFGAGLVPKNFDITFLKAFVKQGQELSDKELAKYKLVLDMQKEKSHYGRQFPLKYFDAPFNFCLTYDGKLTAVVGFEHSEGTLFIKQIQGIKGMHEHLKPIKWERALVLYAFNWAKEHSVPAVKIVSVENNNWANAHGHLSKEQGKMLYDVTARRCGFKQDWGKNYVRYTLETASLLVGEPKGL